MAFYSIFGQANGSSINRRDAETEEEEATVVASENRSSFERETREICLKWVFPLSGDKRKVMQSHSDMLGMMMKAYPDLIVIDNKAREHVEKKTMKATEHQRPFEFYSDLRSKRNRSLVCIHKIRTKNSLAELKEAWGVIDELKKQKAYVRTHAFSEKDREISHLGFIPGVNMANIPREVLKDEIMVMLKTSNDEIPNFEIVQVGVDMGKNSKRSERTRAYEIQCPQRNASRLAKMLQSGLFKEKPVYVPYRMKQSNPSVFKNAIKRQIQILADQWVIKIKGFTPEMITFARDKILESWATGVVPTKNVDAGEWKILVDRKHYSHTMEWLREYWVEIRELIPPELVDGSPFDEQKVVSRHPTVMESGSEEGTVDTYGTILSSLYYGNDESAEVNSDVSDSVEQPPAPTAARPVSYAQVIRETPSTVSQISGWTERRNEEFLKLQEKHTDLESKFHQVTSEIGELKDLIQQLLMQNYQPPTKKQATFETPQRRERRSQREEQEMEAEDGSALNDPNAGNSQHMEE